MGVVGGMQKTPGRASARSPQLTLVAVSASAGTDEGWLWPKVGAVLVYGSYWAVTKVGPKETRLG